MVRNANSDHKTKYWIVNAYKSFIYINTQCSLQWDSEQGSSSDFLQQGRHLSI